MKNCSFTTQVCLSFIQTGLGLFAAFFGLAILFGNSLTDFNDHIIDSLVKTFIVLFSLIIGWVLGIRSRRKNKKNEDEAADVQFLLKKCRNMMIANVIISVFCFILWLFSQNQYDEIQGGITCNVLLLVAVLSVIITFIMVVLQIALRKTLK